MEENNGIKIKANVIYSIVMFPMIWIANYLETLVIKKIIKIGRASCRERV